MREAKHPKRNESTVNETVIDGMMSVMNTPCQALTPKHGGEKRPSVSTGLSPMKRADLRSTYLLKQLGEIRQLHDANVLSAQESEEQRADIVELLRELREHV